MIEKKRSGLPEPHATYARINRLMLDLDRKVPNQAELFRQRIIEQLRIAYPQSAKEPAPQGKEPA